MPTFVVELTVQVKATDVEESVIEWIKQLSVEKDQIKYLGDNVMEDLKKESSNDDNKFVPLTGLKNIWNTIYSTKMGSFDLYVIQTDTR